MPAHPQPAPTPIAELLPTLMAERQLTYRALAQHTRGTDPTGKGITYSHLAAIARGETHPSPETLELIAGTLNIPPAQIAEYALWQARQQLDERAIGITQALTNLKALHRSGTHR